MTRRRRRHCRRARTRRARRGVRRRGVDESRCVASRQDPLLAFDRPITHIDPRLAETWRRRSQARSAANRRPLRFRPSMSRYQSPSRFGSSSTADPRAADQLVATEGACCSATLVEWLAGHVSRAQVLRVADVVPPSGTVTSASGAAPERRCRTAGRGRPLTGRPRLTVRGDWYRIVPTASGGGRRGSP